MTDEELDQKVLHHLYEIRFRGWTTIRCTDVDQALGAIVFQRICKRLSDLGLIELKRPGLKTSPSVEGLITAKGIYEVERSSHNEENAFMAGSKNPSDSRKTADPSITEEQAIDLLNEQITKARELVTIGESGQIHEGDFASWDNTTTNIVGMAFGENHRNVEDFVGIGASTN